jgi:hypothetical protein
MSSFPFLHCPDPHNCTFGLTSDKQTNKQTKQRFKANRYTGQSTGGAFSPAGLPSPHSVQETASFVSNLLALLAVRCFIYFSSCVQLLRMYWISRGQPPRGGPQAWELGEGLTTTFRKETAC